MNNLSIYRPADLLTHKRLDVCAKTLYAKYKTKNIDCDFAKKLYLKHIELWNGFFEAHPIKNSPEDFTNNFDKLIKSIEEKNFLYPDSNYIPIKDKSIYNGAHRLATSIVLQKDVYAKEDTSNGCEIADYFYFKNLGLSESFLDEMVLEFVRIKKNTYTISIFSSDQKNQNQLLEIISKYSEVVCSKEVELTEIGQKNYIISIYLGEKWLGNYSNNFDGASGKYIPCFKKSNKLRVYLVTTDDPNKLIDCKRQIRSLYDEQNHSVHINDTHDETWRICSSIFNKNSLVFLNSYNRPVLKNFNELFKSYRDMMSNQNSDKFCIVSSAVLSLFSIRDCNDIDFLTTDSNFINYKSTQISSHQSEIKYYDNKDEIIFNPDKHLYFDGVKFSTLQNVFEFKSKRREDKDLIDCELIKNKII